MTCFGQWYICHFPTEVLTASTLFALGFFPFATTNPKCSRRSLFPHFCIPKWSQGGAKTQWTGRWHILWARNKLYHLTLLRNGRGCLLQSLSWLIHFLATCHWCMEPSVAPHFLQDKSQTFGPDIETVPCPHSSECSPFPSCTPQSCLTSFLTLPQIPSWASFGEEGLLG